MITNKYRLNEYIITEYERSFYTWETHIAIGTQRSGNCFVINNILVFEPWKTEEAGFLKLEFSEHLMKLKVWNKTLYYCMSSALRDVQTGKRFSESNIILRESDQIIKPGIFRLGLYEITVKGQDCIAWKKYNGKNTLTTGSCTLESDILFIGETEKEFYEKQSKKQWSGSFKSLQKWDHNSLWSYQNVLHTCEQRKVTGRKYSFIGEGLKTIPEKDANKERSLKNSFAWFDSTEVISFLDINKWKQFSKNFILALTFVVAAIISLLWMLIIKFASLLFKKMFFLLQRKKEARRKYELH